MLQMAPIMSIVKETKSKIAGTVPQVANELEEVNNILGDLTDEAGEVTATDLPVEASNDEARKILEETGLIAEEKVRSHFPDLSSIGSPARPTPHALDAIPGSGNSHGH